MIALYNESKSLHLVQMHSEKMFPFWSCDKSVWSVQKTVVNVDCMSRGI